ncbi:hypothetical protein L484_026270 [Morus notabilis]|uniref:Uncharacterized protein n=1 Tax=Morus notabilis TaxID=981085 RepID=W9RV11_9ROSA|nr:1-aminocyclopropane-1-carboxylate oxidase [Morus notabilis]EXB74573.1 hypothetical protein L484_026270 [Morus notabilis]
MAPPINSPEPLPADAAINFRAPPPSPIHSGRKSSFTNDDVLTEFLEHSLRVPDLILPDRIFPKQRSVDGPPVIDFQSLVLEEHDAVSKIAESVADIGCFQVANHGISAEIVRSVQAAAAAGIFAASPEKKAAVTRSPEMAYGFEEGHGEEGESESEEFVWSRDEVLKSVMEGIWPLGYSNFCKQMEVLSSTIEKIGEKVLSVFLKTPTRQSIIINGNDKIHWQGHETGTLCCLYKNSSNVGSECDGGSESLRHEVIRILIRRNDHSHALCLHFCCGSSEFHVYSKKGWVSFTPHKDALVITIGDQIQTWSGGLYKHVIGRPIFKDDKEDCISMAFLYSPPSITSKPKPTTMDKTISLNQQVILAIALTLVYQFLVYIYQKF